MWVFAMAVSLMKKELLDAQKWFAKNSANLPRKYLGKWVAVSGAGIKCSASSLGQLEKELGKDGENGVLLTRLPQKTSVVFCY